MPPRDQPPVESAPCPNHNLLVVGIGASAGGLEAVRKLLDALPADTGMAFVLVQHLDPTHDSMLADLLARDASLRVAQARDGAALEPNSLYVIPPRVELSIADGRLRHSEPQARRGARLPFDFFLNSLAEAYRERAVCVVLSGTGADGAIGLKSIGERGGLIIAQDPEEAGYDGMPKSAIATGFVNLVLPVAKIPRALARYARHPYVATGRVDAASIDEETAKKLAKLIDLLRARTAHDFFRYKKATLLRRIRRRMAAAGIAELDAYIEVVDKDAPESEALAKDLLIHVTSFFRDRAGFEALARTVAPEIVRRHPPELPLRVWTPGCSTGEEVYSVAMLFFEECAAQKRNLKLQIFASDVSPDAVAVGRNGVYPESIAADVSPERLVRFFTREENGYRVSRDLRDAIVFTVQDLLTDPPFSRLDFISCRNLLIYLQPAEQEKVLGIFHFALRDGGYIFLGAAETIGKLTDKFEAISDTQRIFRRIGGGGADERSFAAKIGGRARSPWPRVVTAVEPQRLGLGDFARRLLLETFSPAAVLINRNEQGLYFYGPTDRYLRVPPGESSRDLPAMLRSGLVSAFRAAVRRAAADQEPASVSAKVRRDGAAFTITVSARPVSFEGAELFLVSFAEEPAQKAASTIETPKESARAAQFERELEATHNELESTIRDLEAANQELTSLNEEAISMNEEFQSTNEELETSREELQSLNEELVTSNSQLQESLARESKTSSDLQNILRSSEIATLFLDRDLNIRFFTPACAPLFNLIATDIGRPLGHLMPRFSGVDMVAEARRVLDTLKPAKRGIESGPGVSHLCTISPYRTRDDNIEGVVINLADVSELKASENRHDYAKAIIDTVRAPLVILDAELRVVSASQPFYRYFGCAYQNEAQGGSPPESGEPNIFGGLSLCPYFEPSTTRVADRELLNHCDAEPPGQDVCRYAGCTAANTVGRLLPDTDGRHLDTPEFCEFLERIKKGEHSVAGYEITVDLPSRGKRTLVVNAEEIHAAGQTGARILVSFDDVTRFKQAVEQTAAAKKEAEAASLAKSRFLAAASHDLRQPLQTLSILQATLKRMAKDEQMAMVLAKADRAIESMSAILASLLDINQLEAGAIQPNVAEFPIQAVLETLASEFAEQAALKNLRLRVVPCALCVRSDKRLLTAMLRNLLSNAVRYTDKGGILLGCRRRGDRLLIEIYDTGVGVSQEMLPCIFEEYRQVDGNPQKGGLGLGLAIVQRLSKLLDHPLEIRSYEKKGSMFAVDIPLVTADKGDSFAPIVTEHEGSPPVRCKILLVEDEAPVRESLAMLLRLDGHEVVDVESGEAALVQLREQNTAPDLVISDFMLSGPINGVQTVAALRAEMQRQIPAIVLTGDIRAETLRRIAEAGCVVLNKPTNESQLSKDIQELIAGRDRSS